MDEPVSAILKDGRHEGHAIGLICPNSLCAGQVASLIALHLNRAVTPEFQAISKFVALPHTEGCGCSSSNTGDMADRTLRGYITHPRVALAVMLEHGCEKYSNRFIGKRLEAHDVALDQFGWASIQLDGGIESVTHKVEDWVKARLVAEPGIRESSLSGIGFYTLGMIPDRLARAISMITRTCIAMEGYVVVPASSTLLQSKIFLSSLDLPEPLPANIPYGGRVVRPGFYVMDTPTHDDTDILSGLGATGVDVIGTVLQDHAMQAHPFIPTIQIAMSGIAAEADVDAVFTDEQPATIAERISALIIKAHSGHYTPCMQNRGCTAFQISRGRLGVSL